MDKKKTKSSNKLYNRITILCFFFLLLSLLITTIIFVLILISPLGHYLKGGVIAHMVITVAIIFLISTLLSTAIFYLLSKRIFSPLTELSEKSMLVAKGDFNVQVNVENVIPELQQTLINFNKMVKELDKVETLSNTFINNVSHEFKTPLSTIRSYVNILENSDLSKDERDLYLNKINESIETLSNLISNVLKISKLDNESIKIEKSNYRLDEQIRQCILKFEDQLNKKNINLEIELEDSVINADEEMLNQVWINIISNALKFTPNEGTISISLKQTEELIITISDSGIGMDEETLKYIFDRFYQGETSHNKDGNGLGLAIAKRIIELHEGTIKASSTLNHGSTFEVILPIALID